MMKNINREKLEAYAEEHKKYLNIRIAQIIIMGGAAIFGLAFYGVGFGIILILIFSSFVVKGIADNKKTNIQTKYPEMEDKIEELRKE